jgi:hypothetical protein
MQPKQLPRVFQANLDRLFRRVILPGMDGLPIDAALEFGETTDMDTFLDRCAVQVENYMANEAAKAYALTVAAIFERQLHTFVAQLRNIGQIAPPPPPKSGKPKAPKYGELLEAAAQFATVELDGLGLRSHLDELLLVANVVRHGEGDSCRRLQVFAPHLWAYDPEQYVDLSPGPASISETMRILGADLVRYGVAAMTFWGHADPLDFATRVVPGYGAVDFHAGPRTAKP